ncbi:MAG: LysR family transcriptional regulator [Bradyrhizobiaceae bacterium]|nr:MAG: LysR family transcriptional regulator [Bradyrhizobiaceae bacterium]
MWVIVRSPGLNTAVMTRTSWRAAVGRPSTGWCRTMLGLAKPVPSADAGPMMAAARAMAGVVRMTDPPVSTGATSAPAKSTLRARHAPHQSPNLPGGAAPMHNRSVFDWDDIRFFLAVARHNSTLAAGRALGVNQSTVTRRLTELERRIGNQLVRRHPTGYRLTELGKEMLPFAERIAQAVEGFEQQLAASTRDQVGTIRITCPEPLVLRITQSGLLDRFHARHPGLRAEFVMSDKYLDLGRGDADVALRSGDTDDGVLVGRKIADSLWAVYASRAYVERHGRPQGVADLARHAIVGLDETMANHRVSTWLRAVAPDARIVARNNSVLGLVQAVKSGIGVAPLPTALGDSEPDLVQVFGPVPELTRSWRLLTHPDLRRTRRVAAFFDFIASETEALRPIFTG